MLSLMHTCPGKSVPAECRRAGLGVRRLCSQVGTVLFTKVGLCREGKWCQPASLSMGRGLHACYSQGNTPKRGNNFLSCVPGIFQTTVFMLSVSRLFGFLEQCSALWALSQTILLMFKTPNVQDLVWWGPVLSSMGGSHHAGPDAGLTKKGSHTSAHGCGIWSKAG